MRLVEAFDEIVRARGLHGVPEAPTARAARYQAREDLVVKHGEPQDRLSEIGLDAMVDAEVIRTGPQRREAREAAARERLLALADALLDAAEGLGWGRPESEKAREIIATILGLVIVRGAGGSGDLGGLGCASALPIVTCVRSQARWGGAWVSAFCAATWALFAEWRPWPTERVDLLLDDCGDLVVSVLGEGYRVHHRLDMGIVHPEVWRLLADPDGPTAVGAPLPFAVVVPEFGAVELDDGAPANHPYILAGAIELGREGRVSMTDRRGDAVDSAQEPVVVAASEVAPRGPMVTVTSRRAHGT